MTCVLDTHPVVWFLEGSRHLRARARTVLRDASHAFLLPTRGCEVICVTLFYIGTRSPNRITN